MNKWIVLGIVSAIALSGYFLFQNSDESISVSQKIEPIKKQKKVKKRDIKILYLSDQKKEKIQRQTKSRKQIKNKEQKVFSTPQNLAADNKYLALSANSSHFTRDKEDIQKIITENALQKVMPPNSQESTKPQKFSIYAKNSYDQIDEEKYQNLPPMVPTIITVTTPKGEKYSVVADSKIVLNNDKIYISKNDDKGNPQELFEVQTHKENSINSEIQNDKQSTQNNQNQENIKLIIPPAIGE